MIKKIICPTDFSKASINAAEYAAKLAQVFSAELLFLHVSHLAPVTVDAGTNEKEVLFISQRLKEVSDEAGKMFHISTDHEVDVTARSLPRLLSENKGEDTMIVMGTNGIDDLYQNIFGTNTYRVIEKAKCPVMLVPEGVSYSSIRKIVFAWDYTAKNQFSFSRLKDFASAFDPQFIFFHASKESTEISRDVFRALKSEVADVLGEDNKALFERISGDDITESIQEYMTASGADVLALTYYDRGAIRNLFHGIITKELSEVAGFPILVLHA